MSLYDPQHKELVKKLKLSREESELSQEEVAKKINKTQSFISKLETGQIKVDAILLDKLAKLYKKSINYFME